MTNNSMTIADALRRQAEAETILPEHTLMLAAADELERLHNIEHCARYLVNSNAWVGDTEGIKANLYLATLKELLNGQ